MNFGFLLLIVVFTLVVAGPLILLARWEGRREGRRLAKAAEKSERREV